jgi:hypothetical protein
MPIATLTPTRRTLAGLLLAAAAPLPAWAGLALPPGGKLDFEIWRQGARIGHQAMTLSSDGEAATVQAETELKIKLGPVTLLDYRHRIAERWRGGRFQSLETHTTSNGRVEQLTAERAAGGVSIDTGKTKVIAPADIAPLTHWNSKALTGPLFNPQTGQRLHETVRRAEDLPVLLANGQSVRAVSYRLTGEAEITDWYDTAGVWTGLNGKAKDGSVIEYRRV